MRLLLLSIMTAGMMLFATATAQDGDATEPPRSWLTNTTLSCSTAVPSWRVGCFLERPVFVLGPFELAIGLDAQHTVTTRESHLAPYGILAYYGPTGSVWLEVALPGQYVPVIGRPDFLRVGFTWRFP